MSILKNIFGNGRDGLWANIAHDIGGEYVNSGVFGNDKLIYKHKDWTIQLDTFSKGNSGNANNHSEYTRMRVPFTNKKGFKFKLYHEDFFTPIGKFFGMQDIIIDDKQFDDRFVIKSNKEKVMKHFLDTIELKKLLFRQPEINLEIRKTNYLFGSDYPNNTSFLYFECSGHIRHRRYLLNLFQMFSITLDRLEELNLTNAKAPQKI